MEYCLGDYLRRQVRINGDRRHLSPQQNDLFFMLYVNRGQIVSWETLSQIAKVRNHIRVLAWNICENTGASIRSVYNYGMILDGDIY